MVCPGVSSTCSRSPRKVESIAVAHRHEIVFGFGARAEMDFGAAAVAEFQVSCNKVGMEVSQEHVPNLKPELRRICQVRLNVPLRVNYDPGRSGLVPE
jgi:hypothetical protein